MSKAKRGRKRGETPEARPRVIGPIITITVGGRRYECIRVTELPSGRILCVQLDGRPVLIDLEEPPGVPV